MDTNKIALTYDDIQLLPCDELCTINSRSECDTTSKLTRNKEIKFPVIASPMDTVCEQPMAKAISEFGGIGVIHRFMSIEDQCIEVAELDNSAYIAAAIGVKGDYLERAQELVENGCSILFLDVAHGNHVLSVNAIDQLKRKLGSNIQIVSGTIAHGPAAQNLIDAGIDCIRCGIGGGCFPENMKVKTSKGLKKIIDVEAGDLVYTHTGELKEVQKTFEFNHHKELVTINENIECTPNHEFYVVHKKHKGMINDDNVHEYAEWIKAENLNEDYFLLKVNN